MPTQTRTPAAERVPNPGLTTPVVVGVAGAAAAAWGVHRGAGPLAAVVVALLAVGFGVLGGLLARRWTLLLFVVALVGGVVALRWTEPRLFLAWFLLLLLGLLVGTRVRWRRQQPAAGREHAPQARSPSLRMVVDDTADEVTTSDPGPDDARWALRALDGRTRTGLSVIRGAARLDVGGDAAGPLVVHQCDDPGRRRPLPQWWVLTSGPDPWSGAEVDVRVAGLDAHLPSGGTTTLDHALVALDAFLATGGRAPGLPWQTGRDVDDLRAAFDRWS